MQSCLGLQYCNWEWTLALAVARSAMPHLAKLILVNFNFSASLVESELLFDKHAADANSYHSFEVWCQMLTYEHGFVTI